MAEDHLVDDVPRAGVWSCHVCGFRRVYATDRGALQGAAQHLMEAHRVRLKIRERHHGGMVHAKTTLSSPPAREDER